ncbi:polysaccharide pyruvyl transferase CsaB [bacterium]|nr:polysaccharide pyruvyl transferase CsaB [bacterium]
MTKYVISGYIGFDNFGDEAIAKVLTSYLKSKKAKKITVLSSNPHKTARLYDVYSANYLKFFKPIIESDVLISGGGSLLQDVTSLKSLIYYLAVIVFALVFKKKVIIFAQGFTPFRTKIGKFFTKFVLKYCDKIYVRDAKSQEILKNLNLESELVSDPVFAMPVQREKNKKGVGVQLRSFHTLNDKFLETLADEISQNFSGEIIKLFSLQDSLDLSVLENFAKKLEKRNLKSEVYKNLTVEKATEELSKLEYLISMRFHSSLVAAKAGVKILGINYDIKVLNLAQHIGFPIIGLEEDSFKKEFKDLINLDTSNYNIPEFKFPNLLTI